MRKIDIKTLDAYVAADTKFCKEQHKNADLIIYGYDYRRSNNMIVWNDFNKVMRGIVVNSKGEIKSQPFNKFFTFKDYVADNQIVCSEGQILTLPDSPFVIREKVDGSMGLLYWVDDMPYIATQRSFANPNAQKASELLHTKYKDSIPLLDRSCTYIFEVIFPETNVLVDYGKEEKLVLLGAMNNTTREEVVDGLTDLGFSVAKNFTEEYGHITSFDELRNLNIPNLEGFVITYPETGLKLKIKFEWYEAAHDLVNSILMMQRLIYDKITKLKGIMNWEKKALDFTQLTKEQISALTFSMNNKIPDHFAHNGFEQWLKTQENENDTSLSFDVEANKKNPATYTPMWNLLNKLKNTYI